MTYRLRNMLIALGLAALAAILVSVYVTQYKKDVQKSETSVQVYVATRDIPVGTPGRELIDSNYLRATNIEQRNKVPGAILKKSDIALTYVTEKIYADEQVTLSRFGSSSAQGIRSELTGAQRAIELEAAPQRLLAGTLKAGDHVDVVASWEMPEGSTHHVGKIILRDVLVLHAPETGTVRTTVGSNPYAELSVQLRLTAEQSQKLFFVAQFGEWSLVLRPPVHAANSRVTLSDAASIASEGVSAGNLRAASGAGQ